LQTVSGARLPVPPIAIAGNSDHDRLEMVITMAWNRRKAYCSPGVGKHAMAA
jgi:hypothetical protein